MKLCIPPSATLLAMMLAAAAATAQTFSLATTGCAKAHCTMLNDDQRDHGRLKNGVKLR
jgi:hypothetical protein